MKWKLITTSICIYYLGDSKERSSQRYFVLAADESNYLGAREFYSRSNQSVYKPGIFYFRLPEASVITSE